MRYFFPGTGWSKLLLVLLPIGLLYFGATLYLSARQTQYIFFPSPLIETTPADFNLDYQEVWISMGDRQKLHGWWIPAAQPDAPVILYLHGNGINIGANVGQADRFHQLGLSVLLFDYRGYGQSVGPFPSEAQVYADAEAAWQYLLQRGIPPQRIWVYGHSLGGAIGIDLATRHPNMAGLIVQSSFTSIRQMVDRTTPFGILPIDWILTQKFDSLAKIPSLSMPILLIHGTGDRQIPDDMSQALYEAARSPKQLYLVPTAGHNNVGEVGGLQYLQTICQFMQAHGAVLPNCASLDQAG